MFKKQKNIKRVSALLIVLMLFNFILPVHSKADLIDWSEVADNIGDAIVSGVNVLFLALGDSVINVVQHFVLGMPLNSSQITLSAENIFLNKIPLTNANFINIDNTENNKDDSNVGSPEDYNTRVDGFIALADKYVEMWDDFGDTEEAGKEHIKKIKTYMELSKDPNSANYKALDTMADMIMKIDQSYDMAVDDITSIRKAKRNSVKSYYASIDGDYGEKDYTNKEWDCICRWIKSKGTSENTLGYLSGETIGEKLRSTISKWYFILRNIALIVMLSVLVYIGIRIVLSSVAQEKSKYKTMLVDWLIGICLLFTIHLIMAFITGTVNNITTAIGGLSGSNETNLIMSTKITAYDEDSLGMTALYIVLIFVTLTYLIYYLQRAIRLAFLTLIAPLVAMTYPLDKIADGKSQAFDMWLKEYFFYTLIQPVHLLIYTVFVSSAYDFALSDPLYALVVLWFMKKAEEIIRNMFGFDRKAPGMGGPGTLASMGMTAHAMRDISNALSSKNRKNSSSGSSNDSDNSSIRTVDKKDSDNGGFENDENDDNASGTTYTSGTWTNQNENNQIDNDERTPLNENNQIDNDERTPLNENNQIDNDERTLLNEDNQTNEGVNSDLNENTETNNPDNDSSINGSESNNSSLNNVKRRKISNLKAVRAAKYTGKKIAGVYVGGAKALNNFNNSKVGKGVRFTLKGGAKIASTATRVLGVGVGTVGGAAYGIATGTGVMKNIAYGATVGGGIGTGITNSLSGTTASLASGADKLASYSKDYRLQKQWNEFRNNKQNIQKFKETYGDNYEEKLKEAKSYVNEGYTNFDDIKEGFKIQSRNDFTAEQARYIMKISKSSEASNILDKNKSADFRRRIQEQSGIKNGNRIIAALEDKQSGYMGKKPIDRRRNT